METNVSPLLNLLRKPKVLEVTMRDGNLRISFDNLTILPPTGFRSDYEGWKLPHCSECLFLFLPVLEVTMRDGNTGNRPLVRLFPYLRVLEVTMRDGNK